MEPAEIPFVKSAFYLSILALILLVFSATTVLTAFKSKQVATLVIAGLMGIGSLVVNIISIVKGFKAIHILRESQAVYSGKAYLYFSFFFNSIHVLVFLIIFGFVAWIMIGYRNGL